MEPITGIIAGITLASRLADLLANLTASSTVEDVILQTDAIDGILQDVITQLPEGSPLRKRLEAAQLLLQSISSVNDATGIIARVQGLILWVTGAQLGNQNSPTYIATKAIADRVAADRLERIEASTTTTNEGELN